MNSNHSIILDKKAEEIIENKLATGEYKTVNEVINAALVFFEEKDEIFSEINIALEEGENSGYVSNYNKYNHLKSLNDKYTK